MVKFFYFVVYKDNVLIGKYKTRETAMRNRNGGDVFKITEFVEMGLVSAKQEKMN